MKTTIQNMSAARLLLEQYGVDTLSYFVLHKNKKFFFSSSGESFLAYTVKGNVALVSANPVGPLDDIEILIKEFQYFTKGAGYSPCFVGITKSMIPLLRQYGHKIQLIGNEAEILLPYFNKQVLKKKVRRAEKYILNLGIRCEFYKRDTIPPQYLSQLNGISREWLQKKGKREKGYAMTLGRLPNKTDTDYEIVLAVKDTKVLGFLTFAPIYVSKSLSLDAMRRRPVTPNGLTEFMILQACEYYKKKSIQKLSLNFATFYEGRSKKINLRTVSVSVMFNILRKWYHVHNIYRFNSKFLPEWQERYVAFEKRRYFPYYLYAIAKTEL